MLAPSPRLWSRWSRLDRVVDWAKSRWIVFSAAPPNATREFGPRQRSGPLPPWGVIAMAAGFLALYALVLRFPAFFAIPVLPFVAERPRQILAMFAAIAGTVIFCEIASWVDNQIYHRLRGVDVDRRLVLLVALPAAVACGALGLARVVDWWLAARGHDGFLLCVLTAAVVWFVCRAIGSFLFVLLDVSISALLDTFRDRLRVLVIALLGIASLVAFELAPRVAALFTVDGRGAWIDALGPRLGDAEALHPFAKNSAALVFVLVLLTALPTVTSATGKFVSFVMERIYPLIGALDSVAAGQRNVRVEEGGAAEFIRLAERFNHMVERLALAERMEHAFGMYSSTQLLDRIRSQHGEAQLPASVRDASVLFCDIRGFTQISEALPPQKVVELLNIFFARAVEVVAENDGFLNKFMGDALMVVFNGPIDQPDHAERAARCALALHAAVREQNERRAFVHVEALQIGIGIATGPMISCNIGSPKQMEYTVIGDVVNTAARLCAVAAGGETLMTQATADALPVSIPFRTLEPVSVKGKREPIPVAACVGESVDAGVGGQGDEEAFTISVG